MAAASPLPLPSSARVRVLAASLVAKEHCLFTTTVPKLISFKQPFSTMQAYRELTSLSAYFLLIALFCIDKK
jgi:hypothetical protein